MYNKHITEQYKLQVSHVQKNGDSRSKPWAGLVMYELYTPSFKDTNGDGYGDLAGIRQNLPYLQGLGIEALWMPPIFPSPFKDCGYDVSNYRDIDPKFGTLEEATSLIDDIHDAGMKVVFDLVVNHTSDQHPWFTQSRSSRDNPKSDWFVWKDPRPDGSPPNNWIGDFGGGAWEFDETRQQFYLHTFLPEQPDLNYRNPEVLDAMLDNMRFWFDSGVDGLRLDSLPFVMKHEDFPDEPLNPGYREGDHPFTRLLHTAIYFQPEMLDTLRSFIAVADEYPDQNKFVISEACPPPLLYDEWLPQIYEATDGLTHAPFNSQLISLPWTAAALSQVVDDFYSTRREHDIPFWTLGSHDAPRLLRRIGREQAGVAAASLLTLPKSCAVILCGDEIGLEGQEVPRELKQDKTFIRFDPGTNRSRDDGRLPMAWDDSPKAGFTTGVPWMPIPADYKEHNVQSQEQDPASLLTFYKKLIHHRTTSDAIRIGKYKRIATESDAIWAYECSFNGDREVVLLNFSGQEQPIAIDYPEAATILSWPTNKDTETADLQDYLLEPNGAIIFSIPY
jgi:alpha-glucosidase